MFQDLAKQFGMFMACAMLALACGGVSSNGLGRADGSGAAGSGLAGSGTAGSSAPGSDGAGSDPADAAADLARITGGAGVAGGEASGAAGASTSGGAGNGAGGSANAGATETDAAADGGSKDAAAARDAGNGQDACSPTPAVGTDLMRDPAVNACGSVSCEYKTSYCCAPRSTIAPGCLQSPYGSDKSACVAKGSLPITCDQKAKCQHSTVCCGVRAAVDADLQVITCVEKVDCQAPDLVICGSDADCYVGQICVPRMIYGERMGVCEPAPAMCN